jgi:predicted SAM-dependent methyltransferase
MKLHIGSGTVYLKGWVNVDMPTPNCFLASERPDLVEKWGTTELEGYYAKHAKKTIDDFRKGSLIQEYVCDRYGSFHFLPAPTASVMEILARQSFEHMSITEAKLALDEIKRVLDIEGVVRIDVPDNDETLRMLKETKDDFYIRHFLGPRKGDFGNHCMSYTKEGLISLMREKGFNYIYEEPNIHNYPAFTLVFEKDSYWKF